LNRFRSRPPLAECLFSRLAQGAFGKLVDPFGNLMLFGGANAARPPFQDRLDDRRTLVLMNFVSVTGDLNVSRFAGALTRGGLGRFTTSAAFSREREVVQREPDYGLRYRDRPREFRADGVHFGGAVRRHSQPGVDLPLVGVGGRFLLRHGCERQPDCRPVTFLRNRLQKRLTRVTPKMPPPGKPNLSARGSAARCSLLSTQPNMATKP
jgi:hypothetical protein